MKILIIEDDKDIRELITFMAESNFQATTFVAESTTESVRAILENPDLSAVVLDYDLPHRQSDAIYKHLNEKAPSVPVIVCTSLPETASELFMLKENPPFAVAKKPDTFPAIQEALFRVMKSQGVPEEFTEYSKIRTELVVKLGILNFDLYVKLNESKYIKVFRQGDTFDEKDFQRYEDKKIDHLYMRSEDARQVLNDMTQDLLNLAQTRLVSIDQDSDIYASSLDLIAGFSQSFGFTPEAQKLAAASVKLAMKTVRKNPKLSVLYSKLTSDRENYLASHSVTLAHLTCGLASLVGWNSDTTFYKLTLASFLHDLSLPSDSLSRIHSLTELEGYDYTDEEKKKYKEHPKNSVVLLEELYEIPADVADIILQHHERPSGQGFPAGIDHARIAPLAALFIVAEDLVEFRTKISNAEHLSYFINNLESGYHKGSFKPIVDAMIQSLSDSQV
jgi:HD-GYP domain-containing protein (c-di-GMP phosphodiesterase class II)/CheY-like chemotaxis protein